jgi:hypothetical protein
MRSSDNTIWIFINDKIGQYYWILINRNIDVSSQFDVHQ